jgi:hypothetical protein
MNSVNLPRSIDERVVEVDGESNNAYDGEYTVDLMYLEFH